MLAVPLSPKAHSLPILYRTTCTCLLQRIRSSLCPVSASPPFPPTLYPFFLLLFQWFRWCHCFICLFVLLNKHMQRKYKFRKLAISHFSSPITFSPDIRLLRKGRVCLSEDVTLRQAWVLYFLYLEFTQSLPLASLSASN